MITHAASRSHPGKTMHHPKPRGIELPSGSPLLDSGLTCWRTARAGRFAPIVDAAADFALAREALLRARHSVTFISGEFDARIPSTFPAPDHTEPLGEGELLDPEQAEPVWKMAMHALEDRLSRRAKGTR